MARIINVSTKVIRRPMRMTFTTALGSKKVATSVLVTVTMDDGSQGLAEVPTSFVLPHETVEVIQDTLRKAGGFVCGRSGRSAPHDIPYLRQCLPYAVMSISALEVAILRAIWASRGWSEFRKHGGRQDRIETDITIFFCPEPAPLRTWINRCVRTGFRTFKVKTSGEVEQDVAFLRMVRDLLARKLERFTIRLDGNQGYTARSLQQMFSRLDKVGFQYELFEQPLPKDDLAGLREVTACSPVPIILDETVFTAADLERAVEQRLGHGVNIKIAKSGLSESAALLKLARQARWRTMIGCMSETIVGLSAGILFAAGTGRFDYVDLDSAHFFPRIDPWPGIEPAGPEYLIR